MWAVFWTTGSLSNSTQDHYVISEDETDAQHYLENLIQTVNDLVCAGIGPITNSTEHWHVK